MMHGTEPVSVSAKKGDTVPKADQELFRLDIERTTIVGEDGQEHPAATVRCVHRPTNPKRNEIVFIEPEEYVVTSVAALEPYLKQIFGAAAAKPTKKAAKPKDAKEYEAKGKEAYA